MSRIIKISIIIISVIAVLLLARWFQISWGSLTWYDFDSQDVTETFYGNNDVYLIEKSKGELSRIEDSGLKKIRDIDGQIFSGYYQDGTIFLVEEQNNQYSIAQFDTELKELSRTNFDPSGVYDLFGESAPRLFMNHLMLNGNLKFRIHLNIQEDINTVVRVFSTKNFETADKDLEKFFMEETTPLNVPFCYHEKFDPDGNIINVFYCLDNSAYSIQVPYDSGEYDINRILYIDAQNVAVEYKRGEPGERQILLFDNTGAIICSADVGTKKIQSLYTRNGKWEMFYLDERAFLRRGNLNCSE